MAIAVIGGTDIVTITENVSTEITNARGGEVNLATRLDKLIQVVQNPSIEQQNADTTATTIPVTDSIPQNTEGKQFMAATITPTDANNLLIIEAIIVGATSGAGQWTAALFKDSVADAIAATKAMTDNQSGNVVGTLSLRHVLTAGSTSAITFKINVGPAPGTGTFTFNGVSGGRLYGAITKSSLVIMEFGS